MRYKPQRRGEYFYVIDTKTGTVASDPFVNMKTARKYAQIMNNESR